VAAGPQPRSPSCLSSLDRADRSRRQDDAGNRKPSKRKSSGRIDGLVALTMAIGVAPLQAKPIDVEALIG